ncbi:MULTISPECIES: ABC transporter ATP-binding protein [Rhodococcus]|uniref:ABC transporter ATP-binding protein n=1 Tax=Rhodococcus opacus RKJ300 = JCM 13270 TaxID=1165867 RepID=I0WVH3_RHOOP|nr:MULTISPECIES: ABC transporter ATP-binding protein [Rhodococcus]EID80389.1 ABC transporter ATP-binding protein [Rhodococcus opacus RKJ300 = JCM 13270]QQZ17560.1 ABC transporter ATP-binding protein [Rhodococcus sp. 21391]
MIGTAFDTKTVASARGLGKRFGDFVALDGIDFPLQENKIYGLLGRTGAGKTTLMQILTGQEFQTSGVVEIFGQAPHENSRVLTDVCFVKESQKYPDDFRVGHVLATARHLLPHWNEELAQTLLEDFDLPLCRKVKKLSRGMTSALGVTVGLASRAPLTLFDEPYLGLDAVARHLFYDRLLADYAEHPRTVVLSTHLIDEIGDLIEHVILIDKGRIVLDEDTDALREGAVVVSGLASLVADFTSNKTVLHRESLGNHERATVQASLSDSERDRAVDHGLHFEPLSLQQLVVRSTTATKEEAR